MSVMKFDEKSLEEIKIGDRALFTKTVSETDITLYAGISADFSPLYLNQQFAEERKFKTRTAHPMLIATMAGGAIYRLVPLGSWCVRRNFETLAPVFPGDTITILARISGTDLEKGQLEVSVECYNQKEELVMVGSSLEEIEKQKGKEK